MTEDEHLDEHLAAFGVRPRPGDLTAIRSLLTAETSRERAAQGDGDTLLMKLCCFQLFNSGELADVLLIWRAKSASFDAACSIDIQLLCGSGLDPTKAYLSEQGSPEAQPAVLRLDNCKTSGHCYNFSFK